MAWRVYFISRKELRPMGPANFKTKRSKRCLRFRSRGAKLSSGEIQTSGGNVMVSCGDGNALLLEFVQLEGRKRITALEFANGARLKRGDRFGG